jgi:hypothetical protein
MAILSARAMRHAEAVSEDTIENLSRQIALLRKELTSLSSAVNDYSGSTLENVHQGALVLAREVSHGSKDLARQVSRQARLASKTVHDNPIPAVVALGTIALLSAFLFTRD